MTKEQLGSLILDSERQLYSTAKTILFSDHDCADAIQETIVKAFSNVGTLKNDNYARNIIALPKTGLLTREFTLSARIYIVCL